MHKYPLGGALYLMALLIGRKIALGFALALAALVTVSVVAYHNFKATFEDTRWVTHTIEVLLQCETTAANLKDLESSARGYLLNGDRSFAEDASRAAAELEQVLSQVATLTADNLPQQERLRRLRPLVTQRREISQQLMALREIAASEREQRSLAIVKEGTRISREIQEVLSQITDEENRLLRQRQARAAETVATTIEFITYGTLGAILLVAGVGLILTRSITRPLDVLRSGAAKIGQGSYQHRVVVETHDEVSHLADVFNTMARQIQERQQQMTDQDWLKSSLAEINRLVQGQRDLREVSRVVLGELARRLDAPQLSFYFRSAKQPRIRLIVTYAAERLPEEFGPGEGLVGQCLVDARRITLNEVPENYLISSSLGRARPAHVVLQPVLFEKEVKGIIEAATLRPLTDLQLTLLDQVSAALGVILTTIEANQRTEELLRESRTLSEELLLKQNQLSQSNTQLAAQAEELKRSESLLQEQQEELRQSNEELQQSNEELRQTTEEMEEKATLLMEQKRELEKQAQEIESARRQLELQAAELERTSKYKSDFLASMSHELRTPLNSLLILSKMLADNPEGTLTAKQVQYATTIQSSGQDLLELINDILDLSKIEAGQVQLDRETVSLEELLRFAEATFRPIAETKKLDFSLSLDPGCPASIQTDQRRVEQVIKNLLSNAFKFTERGSVDLKIGPAPQSAGPQAKEATLISFAVTDTGIGIPPDKQQLIFEAFRQADAGTARRYGGTGLGLSISRELARLLGGKIELESKVGKGSRFTLVLPTTPAAGATTPPAEEQRTASPFRATRRMSAPERAALPSPELDYENEPSEDDRANVQPGDLVLLIIEDDKNFARILMDFAREKKFKVVVAHTAARGMALAQQFAPAAITLDLRLPDQDGWVVIDWLKHQPELRHIPVHVMSVDEERDRSLRLGAVSFLQKPITREVLDNALNETLAFINRPVKELLIIEDDPVGRQSLIELVGAGDVRTTAVGTAAEALELLGRQTFDCVVLDLGLPDTNGKELLKEIHRRGGARTPPVIVYTGKELSREEETELRMIAESIIVKNVRSPERLLDETALFLHRVHTKLPGEKRRMIEHGQKTDPVLAGRKVLVVDDDVRNIFAITSALESHQMKVVYAESGRGALQTLDQDHGIDLVLMDVMMPEMDGYEAIREIRKNARFKNLPIISVTAKAMKGDREKCIEAGASDYITKPVDMDKLRSLLRVWLYR